MFKRIVRMNGFLFASLLSNLILVVLIFGQSNPSSDDRTSTASELCEIGESAVGATLPKVALSEPPNLLSSWAIVESDSFHDYIVALRGVGCPEETIQRIVVSELEAVFREQKSKAYLDSMNAQMPRDYWAPSQSLFGSETARLAYETSLVRIQDDLSNSVEALLGVHYEDYVSKRDHESISLNCRSMRYASFPVDTRATILDIEARFEEQVAFYGESISPAQIRRIESQKVDALRSALTDSQYSEYRMWNSDRAEALRMELGALERSRDEFDFLFNLRAEHGIAGSIESYDAADVRRVGYLEAVRAVLGDERHAVYLSSLE